MPDTSEQGTPAKPLQSWLQNTLHDLSQPLTALQCRLFLSMLHAPGSEKERTEMRHAIEDGLRQCERMMVSVRSMQKYVDETDYC